MELIILTACTDSTIISENRSFSGPINLLLIDVLATFIRASLPISLTESDIFFSKNVQASLAAYLYPAIILVGWTLFLIKSFALLNISAARITTEVVPSPTSWSYNWDNSTMTLAAGCSTSNYFKIVAPSFVIVTSPTSSTNILSRPYGPKELFTIFAIANTAVTLFDLTSYPWSLSPRIPTLVILNI